VSISIKSNTGKVFRLNQIQRAGLGRK